MNQQPEREQFEDILYSLLELDPNPNYHVLNEWIRQYPYYEQELIEFASARNMLSALPEAVIPSSHKENLARFGRDLFQSLIGQQQTEISTEQPAIESLLSLGKSVGLTILDIASRTRLSVPLVRKLDRRLIKSTSIPRVAIESIAQLLGQEVNAIIQYLQKNPTLAQGASYRSDQTPTIAEAEDFATAVKNDRMLSEQEREYWLAQTL